MRSGSVIDLAKMKPDAMSTDDILKVLGKISESGLLPSDKVELDFVRQCVSQLNKKLKEFHENSKEDDFDALNDKCKELRVWRSLIPRGTSAQSSLKEFFRFEFNVDEKNFDADASSQIANPRIQYYTELRHAILENPVINIAKQSNKILNEYLLSLHQDSAEEKLPPFEFYCALQNQRKKAIDELKALIAEQTKAYQATSKNRDELIEARYLTLAIEALFPPLKLPKEVSSVLEAEYKKFEVALIDLSQHAAEIRTLKYIHALTQLKIPGEESKFNTAIDAQIEKVEEAYHKKTNAILSRQNSAFVIATSEMKSEALLEQLKHSQKNSMQARITIDEMIRRLMEGGVPDVDLRGQFIDSLKKYCESITPFIGKKCRS